MKGKTVVITGANSGIGRETARELARRGARVVMACRDSERAAEARDDIAATVPGADLLVLELDLASLASVRRFTDEAEQRLDRLDVLIDNAGVFPMTKQMTRDGFEMQIGVNHLGHMHLTDRLLPLLRATGETRVLVVASMLHRFGDIDLGSFCGEKPYNPMRAYGQSKLANVLYTRELAKRVRDDGIAAVCLHPGPVATNIAGRSWLRRTLYRIFGGYMTPKRGARTSIQLATAPDLLAATGSYFDQNGRPKPGSERSRDAALAERLWTASERFLADATASL